MFVTESVLKFKGKLLIAFFSVFFVIPSHAAIQTYNIPSDSSPVYGTYTYDTSSMLFTDVSLKLNLSSIGISTLDKLSVQNFFSDSGNGDSVGYVPGTVNFYTAAIFLGIDGKSRFIFNIEDPDGVIQQSASGNVLFSLIPDQVSTIPEPNILLLMLFGISIIFFINYKQSIKS